jgi:hypothetical protein
MRSKLSTAAELAGLVMVVAAVAFWSPVVALGVAGAVLVVLGVAVG